MLKSAIVINFCKSVLQMVIIGSSHPDLLCKKDVLKNFAKFTGKLSWRVTFFNKIAGWRAAVLKKRLWHRCFFYEFYEIFKNTFLHSTPSVAAAESQMLQLRKFDVAIVFLIHLNSSY